MTVSLKTSMMKMRTITLSLSILSRMSRITAYRLMTFRLKMQMTRMQLTGRSLFIQAMMMNKLRRCSGTVQKADQAKRIPESRQTML